MMAVLLVNIMLIHREDVLFSKVAYPLTELFFKSVYSQGQLTDAYFTSNLNQDLNFSLAFKALRSLGNYQNSLFGSKQFRTTLNFNGEKISTRFFYLSQSFERNENGGLTSTSIENFESEDPIFDERSKLNVKFEDARATRPICKPTNPIQPMATSTCMSRMSYKPTSSTATMAMVRSATSATTRVSPTRATA